MKNKIVKRGLIYGQLIGFFYFLAALCFFWPKEELFLIRLTLLKIHIFIYSLSFWTIFFTVLIAVLLFLSCTIKAGALLNFKNFLISMIISFFVYLGYGIYLHYDYHLPPHFPSYLLKREIPNVVLLVAAASVLSGFMFILLKQALEKSFILQKFQTFYQRSLKTWPLISFLFLFLYFVSTSVFSHLNARKNNRQLNVTTATRAVILGLDGSSWNILIPLLQKGYLKNINRLLKTMPHGSAYGYLDTYGEQFTPPVWASIVTGKNRDKHGINSFGDSIYDWHAKPLWEIFGDYGERVGVVNWMNTYPAVPVNGFMFSKIQRKLPNQFTIKYKEDFDIPVERMFVPDQKDISEENKLDIRKSFSNEVLNLRRVIRYLKNFQRYKLLLFYNYRIDSIQHFFWSDFGNEHFKKFQSSSNSPKLDNVVAASWYDLDNLIGELLEKTDENTILCVISDHGSRKIHKQEIVLNIKKILRELNDPILMEGNESYAAINVLDEETLEVSGKISNREFSGIISSLKSIVFWPSKKPIFNDIKTENKKMSRIIKLELTRDLKILPKKTKKIAINDKLFPFEDFVDIHPWSGRHRARGILIIYGKGVKNRYFGSWLVDSPYFYIFRLLHGRVAHLDKVYPLLKFLHLVDPVTTLDITPTLLGMLGFPVAQDMDGKDFSTLVILHPQKSQIPIKSYGKSTYYDEKRELNKEELKRIKDELRALGYVK